MEPWDKPPLKLGNVTLRSRLILGTGKYANFKVMAEAHKRAGTEMVTVALRRVPLSRAAKEVVPSILDHIDQARIHILPNTAGAQTAPEVLRMARLALDMGFPRLKIEVLGDTKSLFPDPIETLKAVELLRAELGDSITLMVYTNDDPILALKLALAGADAVMPGGSPIGSGRGIQNPYNMRMILNALEDRVPVILDAGIGSPTDALQAMEMGFDGVLLNSAIAHAQNPPLMADAFRLAVESGRKSWASGRIEKKLYASASSPVKDY